ncbi:MAG: zinc ribbon domain-containing protein [Gammaproteobacteria bacterium]|nr:zinc ribbon domain-containing protein [Gammaproteobacteria bacterium]
MPIYEFYCADCHTVFNFFSRRVNTEKTPGCPKCDREKLERRVSMFSVSKGRKEGDEDDDPFAGMDEGEMEKAFMSMAGEMENIDEDDPKQIGRMMRKLYDATGLNVGPAMEEAIRRMESGDDPDQIEQDMGDVLENEDPFSVKPKARLQDLRRQYLPPKVDETLYDL